MAKKNVSIQLTEQSIGWLNENMSGKSLSARAAQAVDECITHRELQAVSCEELKQTFSEEELNLLTDALNGISVQGALRFRQYILYAEISDAIENSHLDAKWGVDKDAILKKIDSLTAAQTAAVYAVVEERLGSK